MGTIVQESVSEAALEYARRGWYVLPTLGKAPAPFIKSWTEESTTDEQTIFDWYSGRSGLGVAVDLRKSGLCVVDGDHLELLEVADLLDVGAWELRGNRKRHSWMFTENGHPIPQTVHPWGEVKAAGGYMVMPPSPHPHDPEKDDPPCPGGDECRYEWLETPDDAPAVIPPEVEVMIAPTKKPEPTAREWTGTPATPEQERRAAEILKDRYEQVRDAPKGSRNRTLNTAALVLGHYVPHYLSEKAVVDTLMEASRENGMVKDDGMRTARQTLRSGLETGMAEPREFSEVAVPVLDVNVVEGTAPLLPDEFWDTTPTLAHIRAGAQAKGVTPAAVLGEVLARVALTTDYRVETDPATGSGRGSLNFIVALVGPPGSGKGGAVATAKALLPVKETVCICKGDHVDTLMVPVATGEGLLKAYYAMVPKTPPAKGTVLMMDRRQVMMTIPEIDMLTATGANRSGTTIMATLRAAWSGEDLGMQTSDAEKRTRIPGGEYRLVVSIGAQPERSGALFDAAEVGGGTTQRFLWLPARGDVLEPGTRPTWPGALPALRPVPVGLRRDAYAGREYMPVAGPAVEEIQQANYKRQGGSTLLRGEDDNPLDVHREALRLRVAALLALLHSQPEVTEEWWGLAGMVMDVSDRTRAVIEEANSRSARKRAEAAGVYRGTVEAKAEEVRDAEQGRRVERVAALAVSKVAEAEEITWSDLRRSVARRDRAVLEDAVDAAVHDGRLEEIPAGDDGSGRRFRVYTP